MRIRRHFTRDGQSPYEDIAFRAAASEILTQGELLGRLGIEARAATLGKARPERIARELHRLTAPDQMGLLFKALAIHSPGLSVPGFDA